MRRDHWIVILHGWAGIYTIFVLHQSYLLVDFLDRVVLVFIVGFSRLLIAQLVWLYIGRHEIGRRKP